MTEDGTLMSKVSTYYRKIFMLRVDLSPVLYSISNLEQLLSSVSKANASALCLQSSAPCPSFIETSPIFILLEFQLILGLRISEFWTIVT
ncbi:hypothetical protein BES34_007705 [Leptospira inadai serovar Lyme]|uniref:Uncharacterized protein n=1 Tax=Leptospira inadai serovar Lyme TaxID=293084 RepID=A0ABX4YJT5_9LEPT|nr:hypothetical protein BES34_007705 [Leptospira inadai serovar Lyme]